MERSEKSPEPFTEPRDFDFFTGGKFTRSARYINVVYLINAPYRIIFWIAYGLRLPPTLISFCSLAVAFAAAAAINNEQWSLALLYIYCTDLLDATDGALARYTHKHTRLGRFLDPTFDWLGITAIVLAIGWRAWTLSPSLTTLAFVLFCWQSLFLHASYYNYYIVRYGQALQEQRLNSKLDERLTVEERQQWSMERVAHVLYLMTLGWQDMLFHTMHQRLTKKYPSSTVTILDVNKPLLTLNSLLLFRFPLLLIGIGLLFTDAITVLQWYALISTMIFISIIGIRQYVLRRTAQLHPTRA